MKANFTIEQLIDEVRKLANEKPDFVYEPVIGCAPACSYVSSANSETEGCIFGQAILRLQPELRQTIDCENIISCLLQDLKVNISNKQLVEWCVIVQGFQDNQIIWKDCVSGADDKIKTLFGKQ